MQTKIVQSTQINQKNKLMIRKTKGKFPEDPYEHHREKPSGLGDIVEKVAKPIAKVIDAVAKTNIQGCGGCAKRKKYLNDKFPLN